MMLLTETIPFADIFELDMWLQAYLILMILDFVTGFLKAYKIEGFKSRKIRDGIVRVLGELVAIMVCGIIDHLLNLQGTGIFAVKILFVFKEVISINENLGIVGVKLPQWLIDKLEDLKDKNNKDNEEEL